MVTALSPFWLIEVTFEPMPPLIVIGAETVPATPPNTAVLAKLMEPALLRTWFIANELRFEVPHEFVSVRFPVPVTVPFNVKAEPLLFASASVRLELNVIGDESVSPQSVTAIKLRPDPATLIGFDRV